MGIYILSSNGRAQDGAFNGVILSVIMNKVVKFTVVVGI